MIETKQQASSRQSAKLPLPRITMAQENAEAVVLLE